MEIIDGVGIPDVARPLAPSYRIANDRSVFGGLFDPSINLMVWRRQLPHDVEPALLAWAQNGEGRQAMVDGRHRDHALVGLQGLLGEISGTVRNRHVRAWLQRDLFGLFVRFAERVTATRYQVSFAPVRTDQCRKLHSDYVKARLITTYVGPGTEWLDDAHVDRAALARMIPCVETANQTIAPVPGTLQRAQAGDVLIMKGEAWPEGQAAVHRSPPLSVLGGRRVVYTITALASHPPRG